MDTDGKVANSFGPDMFDPRMRKVRHLDPIVSVYGAVDPDLDS